MRSAAKWLLGLVIIPLLAACGDPLFNPPAGFGRVEGRLNDELWNGYGYAVVSGDTFYLVGRMDISAVAQDAEEIRVSVGFNGVASYPLTGAVAQFRDVVGGNVVSSVPLTGTMRLAEFDGTFAIGTITWTAPGQNGPLSFASGRFDVPVFTSFGEAPPFPID